MRNGELIAIGDRIQHGEFVEDLSKGSAGKLAERVELRGLCAIQRSGQGDERATVYVVTPEWLAERPEV